VNKQQLRKNEGNLVRIRPVAKRFDGGKNGPELRPAIDDEWRIESVTDRGVAISNVRTGHGITLNYDHIRNFTSDIRGPGYGFLNLTVQVHIGGRDLWIEPDVAPPRISDREPKAFVEIVKDANAPDVLFKCSNLGTSAFFIDQLVVTGDNGSVYTSDLAGPPVVYPAQFATIGYNCAELDTSGFHEANAIFVLSGSDWRQATDPVWFYVFPDPKFGYGWSLGRLADRRPGTIVRQPRLVNY
jgi:hypothetical protein